MRKRFLDIIVVVITEAMIILGVTLRFTTKMLRLVCMCLSYDDDDDGDDGVGMDMMMICDGADLEEEEKDDGKRTVRPPMKVLCDVVYRASSCCSLKTSLYCQC